jgi:hypothetical protein
LVLLKLKELQLNSPRKLLILPKKLLALSKKRSKNPKKKLRKRRKSRKLRRLKQRSKLKKNLLLLLSTTSPSLTSELVKSRNAGK